MIRWVLRRAIDKVEREWNYMMLDHLQVPASASMAVRTA
jgi:hypothetical protein